MIRRIINRYYEWVWRFAEGSGWCSNEKIMNNNSNKQGRAVIISLSPRKSTQAINIGRELSTPNYFTIA